jgi:hypothetical protein
LVQGVHQETWVTGPNLRKCRGSYTRRFWLAGHEGFELTSVDFCSRTGRTQETIARLVIPDRATVPPLPQLILAEGGRGDRHRVVDGVAVFEINSSLLTSENGGGRRIAGRGKNSGHLDRSGSLDRDSLYMIATCVPLAARYFNLRAPIALNAGAAAN